MESNERTVERMENWGGPGCSRQSNTISNSVYFITLESITSALEKNKKQIMNKNSPVVESQLVPDLGIQTPLSF